MERTRWYTTYYKRRCWDFTQGQPLSTFSDTIVCAGGDITVSTHVANFTNSSFDIVTNYAYVASGRDKTTWCAYEF